MTTWGPSNRIAVAVLLVAGLAPFLNAFGNGFVWDDRPLIVDNPYVQDVRLLKEGLLSDFWRVLEDPSRFRSYYRPVTTLTYFLDYAVWGQQPAGYHVTNVLWHLVNVLLVYWVALSLSLERESALVASVLFAVHAVHTESVTWISGRTDVIACAFTLGAFGLALRSRRGPRFPLRIAAVATLYLLAILAKEVAIVLPAALALHFVWLSPRDGDARRTFRAAMVSLTAAASFYLVFRTRILDLPLLIQGPTTLLVQVFNLPVLGGWYLLKLAWPWPLEAHVPLQWLPFTRWPMVLAIALCLAGAAVLLFLLGRRNRVALFAASWVLLFLLPVLNAGTFTDVLVAERFLYLPSVGFAWLLGAAYGLIPRGRWATGTARSVAVLLALTSTSLALVRNRDWRHELQFFRLMVAESEAYPLPHMALGEAYLRSGDAQSAISAFQEAIRRGPINCLSVNSLALAYLRHGLQMRSAPTLDNGFDLVQNALKGPCGTADVLYNTLGEYYMRQRNVEGALDAFRKALALNPLRMGYYHNVGTILFATGRRDEARPYLQQFVARAPRGTLRDQALSFLSQ